MNVAVDMSGRWQRLKAATSGTHERLDTRIMSARAFESRERYALFAQMQHAFHRDIDPLYFNVGLGALLPDLPSRRRFHLIAQDLADLAAQALPEESEPRFSTDADIPTALGWL